MIKLIVTLSILFCITPAFANQFHSKLDMNKPKIITSSYEGSRRQNRLYPTHCPQCHRNNPYLSSNELSALEKYALNKTFKRESDLARLERLENLVFGATQSGDLGSRFANVEQGILSRPKYKTKNSALGNLAEIFTGRPTGYTPSITDNIFIPQMGLPAGLGFSNFGTNFYPSPGYMNQNFEQYSNGPFSQGWGMSNHNYGTGSSVRILD